MSSSFWNSKKTKEDGRFIALNNDSYKIENNGNKIIVTLKSPLNKIYQDKFEIEQKSKRGYDLKLYRGTEALETGECIAIDVRKKLNMMNNKYCFLEFYKDSLYGFDINEIIPFPIH